MGVPLHWPSCLCATVWFQPVTCKAAEAGCSKLRVTNRSNTTLKAKEKEENEEEGKEETKEEDDLIQLEKDRPQRDSPQRDSSQRDSPLEPQEEQETAHCL